MEKAEWELLRSVDRRTRFVAEELGKLKENHGKVSRLEAVVEEWQNDIDELREILKMRRRIRRAILWVVAVVCTASITTFVNYKTQLYIQQDTRIVSPTQREGSKNVNLE